MRASRLLLNQKANKLRQQKSDIGALSASLKETENTLEVSATKIPESSEEKASVAKTPESSLSSSETEKKGCGSYSKWRDFFWRYDVL